MERGDRYWIVTEDGDGVLQVEAFAAVRVGAHGVYGCRVADVARRAPGAGLRGTRRHARCEVFGREVDAMRVAVQGLQQWLARQGRLAVQGELRRRQYLRVLRCGPP